MVESTLGIIGLILTLLLLGSVAAEIRSDRYSIPIRTYIFIILMTLWVIYTAALLMGPI